MADRRQGPQRHIPATGPRPRPASHLLGLSCSVGHMAGQVIPPSLPSLAAPIPTPPACWALPLAHVYVLWVSPQGHEDKGTWWELERLACGAPGASPAVLTLRSRGPHPKIICLTQALLSLWLSSPPAHPSAATHLMSVPGHAWEQMQGPCTPSLAPGLCPSP